MERVGSFDKYSAAPLQWCQPAFNPADALAPGGETSRSQATASETFLCSILMQASSEKPTSELFVCTERQAHVLRTNNATLKAGDHLQRSISGPSPQNPQVS